MQNSSPATLGGCGTGAAASGLGAVSLADLLERRSHGLTEPETWALLCQAVQALQDLFLSDSGGVGRCVPLVTPGSLLVTPRGRVSLPTSRRLTATPPQAAYLAPEYRPGKNFTDTESEKMWIFSLGETLTRTALTSHCAVSRLSPALCRALSAMTRRNAAHRANLMCLLDVISEYCKSRVQTKPFSHIVMDLHREVTGGPVVVPGYLCHNAGVGVASQQAFPRVPLPGHTSTLNRNKPTMDPLCIFPPASYLPKSTRETGTSMADLIPKPRPKSYTFSERLSSPSGHFDSMHQQNGGGGGGGPFGNGRLAVDPNQIARLNARTEEMSMNSASRFQQNKYNNLDTKYRLAGKSPTSDVPPSVLPAGRKYWDAGGGGGGGVGSEEDVLSMSRERRDDERLGRRERARGGNRLRTRRNPVQRAASRLYKAADEPLTRPARNHGCIGPEFVVRASLPSKQIKVGDCKPALRKNVTIILLNGQKLDISCDPNTTTAGQIFEAVIQSENLQENFMLGLSALMSGDFIFLPSDTRVCKVASGVGGGSNQSSWSSVTLFLRVRLFLPSLRGLRGFPARHALYLQLRRSVLEQQLPSGVKSLVTLGGLALQAEFGDFSQKEHGATDYFLLEHYVPETTLNDASATPLRELLTKAHRDRYGLARDKAELEFIQHAQVLPHYGGHFYAAVWITKETQSNVWLCVTARGISLYERLSGPPDANVSPCQAFEWRSIQTLCYSKQFLCILPHSGGKHSKPLKWKLKMDHKKSYFTFRLASLHHQFFLRLRTEYSSLQTLAQEFGIPLKDMKNETNALCKMNPLSNTQETQFKISYHTSSVSSQDSSEYSKHKTCRRSKSATEIRILNDNMQLEEYQNKENENPQKQFGSLSRDVKNALVLDSSFLSSVGNVPSFGRERRHGVLMGTRAIGSGAFISNELHNLRTPSEELERSSLGSISLHCGSTEEHSLHEAYVLNSSVKSTEDKFLPDFHETISDSLMDKFNKLSFIEERFLRSVIITRNSAGSLGLQITEGSDGNVYVQSVIPNGPADKLKSIFKGDQIVAVDGQTLLNLRYDDALNMLKNTGTSVEFVLSQMSKQNQSIPQKQSQAPNKTADLYKSCLNLNHTNNITTAAGKLNTSLYNSCFDISHVEFDDVKKSAEDTFLNCSSIFNNDTIIRRDVDISAINLVDFSRTFRDNSQLRYQTSYLNEIDQHTANILQDYAQSTPSETAPKTPVGKSKSLDLEWQETPVGTIGNLQANIIRRKPIQNIRSVENSYLKHIRYETTAEIDGIYSNTLSRIRRGKLTPSNISKSCGTLNDPHLFIHTSDLDMNTTVIENKNYDLSRSNNKKTSGNDAVIIGMVPKTASSSDDLRANDLQDECDQNECAEQGSSIHSDGNCSKIALPRSLGLGRKWKGPVRYPVTPARNQVRRNSLGTSEDDGTTYTTTSDEEQVFI